MEYSRFEQGRKWLDMGRRICSILVAIALLAVGAVSCAEQLPSPAMPTCVDAELTGSGSVAVKEDFAIQLAADTEIAAAVLAEVQEFVEAKKIAKYFDEESMAAAAECLPENYDVENLMLAEIFALTVENYVVEYGDVEATFAFAAEYADDAILLGMVGLVSGDPVQEDSSGITWIPVPAAVRDGRVVLSISQALLEQISNSEAAVFVLLQDQK